MKNFSKLFFFLFPILFSNLASAQSSWIKEPPEGYLNGYYVGSAHSKSSKTEARDAAIKDAIKNIINRGVIQVDHAEQFIADESEITKNGINESNIVRKTISELNIKGETTVIEGLKLVETYTEYNNGLYEVWALVSVPKSNPITPPNSFSPVWRSILIPGWGQFFKGEAFKGSLFLVGVAGLITTAIISQGKYKDNFDKGNASRAVYERDEYFNRADNWKNIRNITGILGIVLYAYNIFDSISSEGEKLYVINARPEGIQVALNLNQLFGY